MQLDPHQRRASYFRRISRARRIIVGDRVVEFNPKDTIRALIGNAFWCLADRPRHAPEAGNEPVILDSNAVTDLERNGKHTSIVARIDERFACRCPEISDRLRVTDAQRIPGATGVSLESARFSGNGAFMQVSRNQSKGPLAPAPESFIERAVDLEKHGRTDAALDLIYGAVDELLRTDQFAEVESLLSQLSASDFSVDLLLGLLTATLPARSRLPSRERFFQDVEQSLKVRGEFEEGLLTGLH